MRKHKLSFVCSLLACGVLFSQDKTPKRDFKKVDLAAAGNTKIEVPASQSNPSFPYKQIGNPTIRQPEKIPLPRNVPGEKIPVKNERSIKLAPENQVRIANNLLSELANQNVQGIEYLRFLSFYSVAREDIPAYVAVANFVINQLTRSQNIKRMIEVPGSDGVIWMLDIRWFGWSIEAVSDVFSREPFFREPLILPETATAMRLMLGLSNASLPDGAKDLQYSHCFGIVDGAWFIIETGETLRSTAYYDLLFAKERYVPIETPKTMSRRRFRSWPGGVWPGDGKEYKPGEFMEIVDFDATVKVKKTDFPKTEDEWDKAFGIDKAEEFKKEQGIVLENGAVVDGMEASGSIVARQNRLLIRKRGPISYYWKTLDTEKTTGNSNYFQTLQFNPDFKAGEVIVALPNGGQAYALFNKARVRQEEVPPDLAIDKTDPFDFRVRNPGSCIVCHASGIITPDCIVNKFFKAGGDLVAKNKEKQEEIEAFFLRMGNKVEQDQSAYGDFVQQATGTSSVFNAKNYSAIRYKYKSPITVEKAALELGVGQLELELLASRSIKSRTVALALNRGFPVPRTTWDEEVFPELVLLVSLFRDKARASAAVDLETLVDQAIERYVDVTKKIGSK